jgi:hypothetical protein
MTETIDANSSTNNDTDANQTSNKSVVFLDDDRLCVYFDGAIMEEIGACHKDIWYQHTDLAHIKRKAMVVSKEAHRYGFGSLLTNTYGRTGDDTQEALNTWVCNGNSRRGLERWINDEYAAKRADIRRRTIQSVLRAQSKMKEEGMYDYEYSSKVIARLSEAFSIDSRNFARAMGVADEVAATQVPESSSNSDSNSISKNKDEVTKPVDPRKLLARSYGPPKLIPEAPRLPHRRNIALSGAGGAGVGEFRHFY